MPVLISQTGGRGLKSTSQISVHHCFLRVCVLSTSDMLMDGLKRSFESQTKTVFDLHGKKIIQVSVDCIVWSCVKLSKM